MSQQKGVEHGSNGLSFCGLRMFALFTAFDAAVVENDVGDGDIW